MKKVTILALQPALPAAITTITDIFRVMSVDWHHPEIGSNMIFQVEIATIDGKPIQCSDYCIIQPHNSTALFYRTG